jgi:hypothetical protein
MQKRAGKAGPDTSGLVPLSVLNASTTRFGVLDVDAIAEYVTKQALKDVGRLVDFMRGHKPRGRHVRTR